MPNGLENMFLQAEQDVERTVKRVTRGPIETVSPTGLRERAKIMRDNMDESCARHLELAADEIERLRRELRKAR